MPHDRGYLATDYDFAGHLTYPLGKWMQCEMGSLPNLLAFEAGWGISTRANLKIEMRGHRHMVGRAIPAACGLQDVDALQERAEIG